MIKDTKTYNILVIEDNRFDRILITDYLNEQVLAPNIQLTDNYKEAKLLLAQKSNFYDVILLDLSLPDKNGENLIREIVSVSALCPVIVLTGFDDTLFSIKSLAWGVSDYLLKEDINAASLYKSIISMVRLFLCGHTADV